MQLSFTERKSIRKNFGKLKETLSIPNLIEVQKKLYYSLLKLGGKKREGWQKPKRPGRSFKKKFPKK